MSYVSELGVLFANCFIPKRFQIFKKEEEETKLHLGFVLRVFFFFLRFYFFGLFGLLLPSHITFVF